MRAFLQFSKYLLELIHSDAVIQITNLPLTQIVDIKGNHTEEISFVIKQPTSTVTVLDETISSNQCHLLVVVVYNFEHVSSLDDWLPIKHIV